MSADTAPVGLNMSTGKKVLMLAAGFAVGVWAWRMFGRRVLPAAVVGTASSL